MTTFEDDLIWSSSYTSSYSDGVLNSIQYVDKFTAFDDRQEELDDEVKSVAKHQPHQIDNLFVHHSSLQTVSGTLPTSGVPQTAADMP